MTSTLDPRLQALLDKQEIYELVCAYCNAADRHDHAKMRSLYHDDAIDEHGSLFSGLEFHSRLDLRESVFQKVNAERQVWQQRGELSRVTSEELLAAATTYIDLLAARTGEAVAQQMLTYSEEILEQAKAILKVEEGAKFQAEAIQAEANAIRGMIARLRQQGDLAELHRRNDEGAARCHQP